MDWTAEKAREAEATLRKWYALAGQGVDGTSPYGPIVDALASDLNTPQAIGELHQLAHAEDIATLRASLQFLGLMGESVPDWVNEGAQVLDTWADRMSAARALAMETKDFSEVDRLKSGLTEAGVEVRMGKEGVELLPAAGFDPSKLEALS